MSRCLAVGISLALLAFTIPRATASDHAWLEIRSPHFRVLTDTGEKRGIEVAGHCEQMRAAFLKLMPQAKVNDPAPLLIFALRGQNEVGELAFPRSQSSRHSGVFIPGTDASFIVLDATGNPWHAVFHEYAHELLHANLPATTQTWFDEGFAEYFSTLEASENKIELGRVPIAELQFLREKGKLMRLANLVTVTQDSEIYNQNGPMQATFYAQSWLLVHYLFDHQLVGRAQAFFELIGEGSSIDDAVPAAFGMTRQKLEDDLLAYAQGERFRFFSMSLPLSQPETTEVTSVDQVTESALELEARWETQAGHREEDAVTFAAQYRTLLAQQPENADALRGMGMMLMESRNYQESLSCLQKAVQFSSRDASNHHAFAQLLNRMESNGNNTFEAGVSSEHESAAALALDPDYADAYYLNASAQARNGRLENAVSSIRIAVALSPRVDGYKLMLADLELRGRQYDVASSLLRKLARSHDPEIARKAELFLSADAAQSQRPVQ